MIADKNHDQSMYLTI